MKEKHISWDTVLAAVLATAAVAVFLFGRGYIAKLGSELDELKKQQASVSKPVEEDTEDDGESAMSAQEKLDAAEAAALKLVEIQSKNTELMRELEECGDDSPDKVEEILQEQLELRDEMSKMFKEGANPGTSWYNGNLYGNGWDWVFYKNYTAETGVANCLFLCRDKVDGEVLAYASCPYRFGSGLFSYQNVHVTTAGNAKSGVTGLTDAGEEDFDAEAYGEAIKKLVESSTAGPSKKLTEQEEADRIEAANAAQDLKNETNGVNTGSEYSINEDGQLVDKDGNVVDWSEFEE